MYNYTHFLTSIQLAANLEKDIGTNWSFLRKRAKNFQVLDAPLIDYYRRLDPSLFLPYHAIRRDKEGDYAITLTTKQLLILTIAKLLI